MSRYRRTINRSQQSRNATGIRNIANEGIEEEQEIAREERLRALVWLDFVLFNHKSKACVLLMLLVECIEINE